MDPFESLLIHTATIRRPTDTLQAAKRPTTAYVEVAAGVKCRVKPVKADSKQAIGGYVTDSDHKAYFLAGVDVREKDLVIVGDAEYDVRGVERPVDEDGEHHVTAHLNRRTGG
ncbi:MAG: hypothetical protein ACK47B_23815 [Armatimonadota bacterium]